MPLASVAAASVAARPASRVRARSPQATGQGQNRPAQANSYGFSSNPSVDRRANASARGEATGSFSNTSAGAKSMGIPSSRSTPTHTAFQEQRTARSKQQDGRLKVVVRKG